MALPASLHQAAYKPGRQLFSGKELSSEVKSQLKRPNFMVKSIQDDLSQLDEEAQSYINGGIIILYRGEVEKRFDREDEVMTWLPVNPPQELVRPACGY